MLINNKFTSGKFHGYSLSLYDQASNSRVKIPLTVSTPMKVFVCGPTLYDGMHLGHARCYIIFDVLVRFCRALGYSVKYIQNLTDLGRKVYNAAKKAKLDASEFTSLYFKQYVHEQQILGIQSVDEFFPYSAQLERCIELVSRLDKMDTLERRDEGVFLKTNATKFVSDNLLVPVWLFDDHWGTRWDSPVGHGHPSWHLLDIAVMDQVGFINGYDIHGGGIDLVSPHHNSIRAILTVLTGQKRPVQCWANCGLVKCGEKKMGKSEGNALMLADLFMQMPPQAVRFYLLSSSYYHTIDYQQDTLNRAVIEYELIMPQLPDPAEDCRFRQEWLYQSRQMGRFISALFNNLDVTQALNVFKEEAHRFTYNENREKSEILSWMREILGL